MAFFMIGAVHAALMVLVMKTAATMVNGWNVFGLVGASDKPSSRSAGEPRPAPAPAAGANAPRTDRVAAAGAQAQAGARRIDLSAPVPAGAANDGGSARGGPVTRIYGGGTPASAAPSRNASLSRAHGIGSRFRAPQARPATMEKLK
jgi:type IV secretion system protein VirB6